MEQSLEAMEVAYLRLTDQHFPNPPHPALNVGQRTLLADLRDRCNGDAVGFLDAAFRHWPHLAREIEESGQRERPHRLSLGVLLQHFDVVAAWLTERGHISVAAPAG